MKRKLSTHTSSLCKRTKPDLMALPCSDKDTADVIDMHSANAQLGSSRLQDINSDLYRTGAKCVPGPETDLLLPGADYHITKVLRTKPGRGDPTQSLSCSDKIARWNVLGCQGCFPMIFLEKPIYINHIIVSG